MYEGAFVDGEMDGAHALRELWWVRLCGVGGAAQHSARDVRHVLQATACASGATATCTMASSGWAR